MKERVRQTMSARPVMDEVRGFVVLVVRSEHVPDVGRTPHIRRLNEERGREAASLFDQPANERRESLVLIAKNCARCGTAYHAALQRSTYCSDRCRAKAQRTRVNAALGLAKQQGITW